MNYEGEAVLT